MQKFKVGDQVQLKSGGPVMTVEEVDRDPLDKVLKLKPDKRIGCVWMVGKRRCSDYFDPRTLKVAELPEAKVKK